MSNSDRAFVLVVVLAAIAGYIACLAWPPADPTRVEDPYAAFCLVLVALLTFVVLHARKGRP